MRQRFGRMRVVTARTDRLDTREPTLNGIERWHYASALRFLHVAPSDG